jgi:hypothetical protein
MAECVLRTVKQVLTIEEGNRPDRVRQLQREP